MGLFQNDFFTAAGQKERLANVGNTLLSAVGLKKGGVQSNTGVKTVDAVLSAAASHPFITAGAAAAVVNPAGLGALSKTVAKSAITQFSSAKFTTQAAVVGGGLLTAGAVARRPGETLSAAASLPSSITNFGGNIADLAADPSLANLTKLGKENPILAGTSALGVLGAVGVGAGALANTLATSQNTKAIKESTMSAPAAELYPSSVAGGKANLVAPATDSSISPTPIPRSNGPPARKRRAAPKASPPRISQNVRVYNIDDRDINDRKVYKQR